MNHLGLCGLCVCVCEWVGVTRDGMFSLWRCLKATRAAGMGERHPKTIGRRRANGEGRGSGQQRGWGVEQVGGLEHAMLTCMASTSTDAWGGLLLMELHRAQNEVPSAWEEGTSTGTGTGTGTSTSTSTSDDCDCTLHKLWVAWHGMTMMERAQRASRHCMSRPVSPPPPRRRRFCHCHTRPRCLGIGIHLRRCMCRSR